MIITLRRYLHSIRRLVAGVGVEVREKEMPGSPICSLFSTDVLNTQGLSVQFVSSVGLLGGNTYRVISTVLSAREDRV